MKRIGALVCLSAMLVLLTTSICFGANLELKETYPRNDQKSTSIDNLGVKLYFNNEINDPKTEKINADCFKILDPKGKEIPLRVLYQPKEQGQVMVLADNTSKRLKIESNSTYKLIVSGDFVDNDGNALGDDVTVKFTTINQTRNAQINMIMMVVMFGGIFFFSSRSMKKEMVKQQQEREKEAKVNPYKEAKKTGKTVEEIVEKAEKEKAKKAARAARKAARARGEEVEEDDDELYEGIYKLKKPQRISEGGSSYITGRKAIAEAKAAEEARRAKKIAAQKKKKK